MIVFFFVASLLNRMYPAALQRARGKEVKMQVLTVKETCELLRICRTTLWSLRKKGELKGFNVGGRVFYTKDEIVEYIERLRSNK